jgi:hypothetical protein
MITRPTGRPNDQSDGHLSAAQIATFAQVRNEFQKLTKLTIRDFGQIVTLVVLALCGRR